MNGIKNILTIIVIFIKEEQSKKSGATRRFPTGAREYAARSIPLEKTGAVPYCLLFRETLDR